MIVIIIRVSEVSLINNNNKKRLVIITTIINKQVKIKELVISFFSAKDEKRRLVTQVKVNEKMKD